jgi:hypothetical protein
MSYEDHVEIQSEQQATQWLEALVNTVEKYRGTCDVMSANPMATPGMVKKAYHEYFLHRGIAIGALTALAHTRKLSPVGFEAMKKRINFTAVPTVINRVTA